MGSRMKRARATGIPALKATPKPATAQIVMQGSVAPHTPGAPPPMLNDVDVVWNSIDHMPPYDAIPEEFKRSHNRYCQFVSDWFFSGRKPEDMARLITKAGIDRVAALRAVHAILGSWRPKHEHKEAACAYLLSEWFTLDATP